MKNYRLKLKDLFKGRIVYMVQPGCTPVKVQVVGHVDSTLVYSTIAIDTSGGPVEQILRRHNGEYQLADRQMVTDIALKHGHRNPIEPHHVALIKTYRSPIKYVMVVDGNKVRHDIQDIYLDPSESRVKVFAKLKQAERYANFPETFKAELESIFTVEE